MTARKTVVIHQPDFLPYLGFFDRLLHADVFIVLDHVQFVKSNRSWTHRDKIKTVGGENWLTVSVRKAPRDTPINKIELSAEVDWVTDNLNVIRQNYRDAPFFPEIMPHVQQLYTNPPALLAEFTMRSIDMLLDLLDIRIPTMYSSTMNPQGSKNGLLIDLLQKVGATHYLSGTGARAYLQVSDFEAAGIEVIWQKFNHPVYPQQHGEFIPFLSVLDALFNCGIEGTRKMLRSAI